MGLKRLELWWRAVWIRLLVRLMRRPDAGSATPDWGARPHRVLFLRHDRAGDMIVSTGVMRAIARSHPTIRMDVLASPANAAIIQGAEYVATVIVFDKKKLTDYLPAFVRLRRARYDAVIDCMVTAPSVTTLLLVLASGARYRVGIAGRETTRRSTSPCRRRRSRTRTWSTASRRWRPRSARRRASRSGGRCSR